MNWLDLAKQGVVAVIVAIFIWVWRDGVWEDRIATAPSLRDTVVVRDTVTLPTVMVTATKLVPDTRIDTILVYADKDSLIRDLAQIATLDTLIGSGDDTVDLHIKYTPLDHKFDLMATFYTSDMLVIDTRTVIVEPEIWQYALLGASSLLVGYGLADEDYIMAGIGGATLLAVSITL